jgi:hypothetical protein
MGRGLSRSVCVVGCMSFLFAFPLVESRAESFEECSGYVDSGSMMNEVSGTSLQGAQSAMAGIYGSGSEAVVTQAEERLAVQPSDAAFRDSYPGCDQQ